MIILERSTSIVFSVHSLSSLKILFYMTEKKTILDNTWLYLRIYLNNLTKLTEILTRKNSMRKVLFHFWGEQVLLRIMVSVKNLGQYKKLPWNKFVKKNNILQNILHYAKPFKITLLSWWFNLFSKSYQCLLMFIYPKYIVWWGGWWTWTWKKDFIRYHLHRFF